MDYTPTTWKSGDTITAENLNKIENAILELFDLGISTGSWTPGLSGMSTYSYQKGTYLKIGDVVIVSFTLWGTMSGSTTEKIKITGCPFVTAKGGYSGGGWLSGYHVSDDIVFSGWNAETDGSFSAYGQRTGAGTKWGTSGIYQQESGECGGGGTIMFKVSS